METNDEEQLIPPTLSITLPPLPPPSRPPTKEDVDRAEHLMNMIRATLSPPGDLKASPEDFNSTYTYYLRVCEKYERSTGLQGRTVTDALVGISRQLRDVSGQIRDLAQQSSMQLELTHRMVESMFAGRSEVVQSLRQQVIARNRGLTESGQPAMEVVFLDGTRPSSQNLPPLLRYYHEIVGLTTNHARQYARGHGIVARAVEIRDRLSEELGVVQASVPH
ncbi:hypothetical protein V1525DRAFT_380581 [Lipomyces kononenkoae]|uniref:Uncharacterized protein n=1 Tax=Lipomyces kononenkoae TaxID=34357 RepID=A0ACC3SW84_LIPKO